jgi:dienelactone hydrolase
MASIAMALAACVPSGLPQPGGASPGRIEASAQPDGAETWLLPSGAENELMRTKVYRPEGKGPFPMVVVSHGSEQDPVRRGKMTQPAYPDLTRFFVQNGYVVVVPERPGHGAGGRYLEDQRGCDNADYAASANGAADSIAAAVDFMKKQDFVQQQGIVLAGHSAGAFGSLAYAARQPAGVSAVVNFSGGRGGHHMNRPGNNCAPGQLVETTRRFGATTRVPTLWIYAENDTYFTPALSREMADAFSQAGGRAEYVLLPPVGSEGHGAIRSNAWRGALTTFVAPPP